MTVLVFFGGLIEAVDEKARVVQLKMKERLRFEIHAWLVTGCFDFLSGNCRQALQVVQLKNDEDVC